MPKAIKERLAELNERLVPDETIETAEYRRNGNAFGVGRPRRPGRPAVGERVGLGVRVTPEMKRRIEAECQMTGRSQSQEVEYRLERSFWLDDLLKARLISARIPAGGGPTWQEQPTRRIVLEDIAISESTQCQTSPTQSANTTKPRT